MNPAIENASGERAVNTLVARPVGKKEIRANPKAQQAPDVGWEKLVKKTAWKDETSRDRIGMERRLRKSQESWKESSCG